MINDRRIALLLAGLALAGCSETSDGDAAAVPSAPQAFPACDAEFVFEAPNPSYPWTPKAIHLVSEKLAPGVFAIYDSNAKKDAPKGIALATSGGFVIGEDSVLLVESMVNRQLFCQVIDLVQTETDKPIKYVVNTSHHGDHSFGNMFLPEGVHIVQHERMATFLVEGFESDKEFMIKNFGTNQGIEEIQPVVADTLVNDNDVWSVDLGGVSVEAKYFGFAQTGEDLFIRVPSAKVAWTGNALVAEKPAVPWLLNGHAEETGMTLAQVKASLPEDAIVVPGHDHPVALDGFDFSIDYLGALVSEVGASVAAGKTKEETVAAVTMEPFQGYNQWGWVHKGVNVPNTYDELKQ